MKHIKHLLIGALLITASTAYALTSYFEISAGGGWSTLGYGLNNAPQPGLDIRQNGSYGLNAHLGYGLQFSRYIGIGLGVDISRYGSAASLSGDAMWQGVVDTEGELYDHVTTVQQWADRQNLLMLEIPLSLFLRFPVSDNIRLYSQLGIKASLPLKCSGEYSGSLSHHGAYEPWMVDLTNVTGHGFYNSTMSAPYDLQAQFALNAFLKLGIEGPLDEYRIVWLYGALYGSFYCTPVINTPTGGSTIGWRNDTDDPAMQQAHYFMNDYAPIFTTNLASGAMRPIAVGAEIGLRFRIPHSQHYGCKCDRDQ